MKRHWLQVSFTFFTASFKLLYDLRPPAFQRTTQEALFEVKGMQNAENCHWTAGREKAISHRKLIKHSYSSALT